MAFFDARLAAVPVRGVALVQLGNTGAGAIAVALDHPGAIEKSFARLGRTAQTLPAGAGSRQHLDAQTTPDGAARIGVPPGWRMTGWGNGAVDVAGPNGQLVDVGVHVPISAKPPATGAAPGALYLPFIADPAAAVRAVTEENSRRLQATGGPAVTGIEILETQPTAPPTGSGRAVYLLARSELGGRPYLSFSLVNTAPVDRDAWIYYFSTAAAPLAVFQRDLPLMLQVWQSWSLNQQMQGSGVQETALKMKQTGEILRAAAKGQTETYERASKGFEFYVQRVEALAQSPAGAGKPFDAAFAAALVKASPSRLRLLSPAQYQPE
jgi:hypothetical protein